MALSHVVRPLDPPIPVRTRGASPFRATWTDTLTLIEHELVMLGAPRSKPWVLQLDVPESRIRKDGGVYANTTAPPPVRIAFESRHGPLLYACDKFWKWQDNVRAIALSLEALRKVDRYGVAGAGEQYRGWTAISSRPAEMTREQAAQFLCHLAGWAGPDVPASLLRDTSVVVAAYRDGARRVHPDVTGDDGDTMARLNAARDLLLAAAS